MRNIFVNIVNTDGKLVGPLVVAIADREVPALEFRVLVKVSEPQVVPVDEFIRNDKTKTVWLGGDSVALELRDRVYYFMDSIAFGSRMTIQSLST